MVVVRIICPRQFSHQEKVWHSRSDSTQRLPIHSSPQQLPASCASVQTGNNNTTRRTTCAAKASGRTQDEPQNPTQPAHPPPSTSAPSHDALDALDALAQPTALQQSSDADMLADARDSDGG
ncbi:uncharacterized protein UV8b_02085 [Ustilaginoidea virens]|uniref:Uncharacterized protein n=1 Tax=Ustilaginoidea virens TaxID=1159556 RepID=A0A8E5HLZ5_USTVR|nr:uncharacterized protein UV8b_02085 [Ustilaginoidea virens]QUC17844.1 hypothetical protein UV8b_02085 [Ustilaginoidea virens]